MNSNIRLLIYDVLKLIDAGKTISCTEIDTLIKKGELVNYLLEKYKVDYIKKGNPNEANLLIAKKSGVFSNENFKEINGLLYLIEVLLDC
ncbi:MAG: hypothetical protein IKJ19_04235 [Clostridia bacterium]|nr:hypothetical protein [Clostridia bacterium]